MPPPRSRPRRCGAPSSTAVPFRLPWPTARRGRTRPRSGGASSRGPLRIWRRPWSGVPRPPRSWTACNVLFELPG
eukprot:11931215-Alexandrium_andersonii.AAC.1